MPKLIGSSLSTRGENPTGLEFFFGDEEVTARNKRRLILYPCAMGIALFLIGLSVFYEVDADASTLVSAAQVYAKLGLHDKALENCQKVLAKTPEHLEALLVMGLVYDLKGDFQKALSCYEKAENLHSDPELNKAILLAIADRHRQVGNFDKALACCSLLKEKFPHDKNPFLVEGMILAEQGMHEEAVEQFVMARGEPEKEIFALYYLGKSYCALHRMEEALKAFQSLASVDSKAFDVWMEIARIYACRGDKKKAEVALAEAYKLNPSLRNEADLSGPEWEGVRLGELPPPVPEEVKNS